MFFIVQCFLLAKFVTRVSTVRYLGGQNQRDTLEDTLTRACVGADDAGTSCDDAYDPSEVDTRIEEDFQSVHHVCRSCTSLYIYMGARSVVGSSCVGLAIKMQLVG